MGEPWPDESVSPAADQRNKRTMLGLNNVWISIGSAGFGFLITASAVWTGFLTRPAWPLAGPMWTFLTAAIVVAVPRLLVRHSWWARAHVQGAIMVEIIHAFYWIATAVMLIVAGSGWWSLLCLGVLIVLWFATGANGAVGRAGKTLDEYDRARPDWHTRALLPAQWPRTRIWVFAMIFAMFVATAGCVLYANLAALPQWWPVSEVALYWTGAACGVFLPGATYSALFKVIMRRTAVITPVKQSINTPGAATSAMVVAPAIAAAAVAEWQLVIAAVVLIIIWNVTMWGLIWRALVRPVVPDEDAVPDGVVVLDGAVVPDGVDSAGPPAIPAADEHPVSGYGFVSAPGLGALPPPGQVERYDVESSPFRSGQWIPGDQRPSRPDNG